MTIITCKENPEKYSADELGGKGLNLLKLYQAAQSLKSFMVPEFFVIPADAQLNSPEIRNAFDSLPKPLVVRSSSPLEDGNKATFAGMFESYLGQNSFEQFLQSAESIRKSVNGERVRNYANSMNIPLITKMPIIVQREVVNPLKKGVIQLDEFEGIMEGTAFHHKIDYRFLKEYEPWGPYLEPHDFISEGESHNASARALEVKKHMGLEGLVQIEFCLKPTEKPYFVQIRKLPERAPNADFLNLFVPDGVPFIESKVCNSISGEIVLPAYVTVSQSGLTSFILIPTGQDRYGEKRDSRADNFYDKSKLANNQDFISGLDANQSFRSIVSHPILIHHFESMWKMGDELFKDYILVCDKLDETIVDMSNLTINKRAIITCCEENETSHAMTVARDLKIMAMGVNGDMSDMNYFYHQVETGDLIHMKSDGRRAVAYIEKRRERDPYEVRE